MVEKPLDSAELYAAASDFLEHADLENARQAVKSVLTPAAEASDAAYRQQIKGFILTHKKASAAHLLLAAYMLEYAVSEYGGDARIVSGSAETLGRLANDFIAADRNKAEETLKRFLHIDLSSGASADAVSASGAPKPHELKPLIADGKKNAEAHVVLAALALEHAVESRGHGRRR